MTTRVRQGIQQDFNAYRKSIDAELKTVQDRVRNLIGDAHWETDGEHKEAALRKVLRMQMPETVRVGTGFVSYPNLGTASAQVDVMITQIHRPVLYRDGDLVFVTASCVEAVVEVKTRLTGNRNEDDKTSIFYVTRKLADQIQQIRRHSTSKCWAGLFVYDDGSVSHEAMLQSLQSASRGAEDRAIDCVSVGESMFAHYWENGVEQVGGTVDGPVWHSYDIQDLSPAYFVSNMVMHVSPRMMDDETLAWFPIEEGKESRKRFYARLNGDEVLRF